MTAEQKSKLTIFLGLTAQSEEEKRRRLILVREVVAVDVIVMFALLFLTQSVWSLLGWAIANMALGLWYFVLVRAAVRRGDLPNTWASRPPPS